MKLRQLYERDGFVVVRKLISDDELAVLRARIDAYKAIAGSKVPAPFVVFEQEEGALRNLLHMHVFDDWFLAIDRHLPAIRATAAALVDWTPRLEFVETFNKPARVGSTVPLHQDELAVCVEPPDMLTVWITLDPSSEANGGLRYLPGSHKLGALKHVSADFFGHITPEDAEALMRECQPATELQPGDATIHHGHTLHYSPANTSSQDRLAIGICYRGEHTRIDAFRQLQVHRQTQTS